MTYIVAHYYARPSHQRVHTQKAGWMDNKNNLRYDEQITITKKLKNRDLDSAKIILDVLKRQVVRNSIGANKDFDELFDYFVKNYPDHMRPLVSALASINQTQATVIDHPVRTIDTSGSISSV